METAARRELGWMKAGDVIAKWEARLREFERVRAHIDGAVLCREALEDFAEILDEGKGELLNLSEAARESGYSADHLGRLVKAGVIPNAGRPHAPRIRRADLPRKATALRGATHRRQLSCAVPVDIARAVVNSKPGATR